MDKILTNLKWLKNRLLYKCQESQNSQAIQILDSTINTINFIHNDQYMDILIKKYFPLYDITADNTDDSFDIGMTPKEQEDLRCSIKSIIVDFLNNEIHHQHLNDIDFDHDIIYDRC